MPIILKKKKIACGIVACDKIYLDTCRGTWKRRVLNDDDDLDGYYEYNLPYSEKVIPKYKVKEMLKNNISLLTEEEMYDLKYPVSNTVYRKLLDNFPASNSDDIRQMKGVVEKWIKDCIEIGINPIPNLKRILKGICDVTLFKRYDYIVKPISERDKIKKPMLIILYDTTDGKVEISIVE